MELKEVAIQRAVKQLVNLGCLVKVIGQNGEVIANTIPEEKKQGRKFTHTEELCHYKEKLEKIQPGELVSITAPNAEIMKSLQSSMTSYMANRYGSGSYVSKRDSETNSVSILRVE